MGLSAAVALDISVTLGLSYYLRKSKTGFTTCVFPAVRPDRRLTHGVEFYQYERHNRHPCSLYRRDWDRHLVSRVSFNERSLAIAYIGIGKRCNHRFPDMCKWDGQFFG